jgi:6-phosphogluconolactonase
MTDEHNVLTLDDSGAVAETAAEIFIATATASAEVRGRFVCALAGGSTPEKLYTLLARPEYAERVPWDKTWICFGDERCVPKDHPDSNFRMTLESLLHKVPVVATQVLRIKSELDNPSRAALFYEQKLRELFPGEPFPRFDLVLLGIGLDGHTASLFPGTDALKEAERWVTANYVPQLSTWRITLTLPSINAARQILFLATGLNKAVAVAQAFGKDPHDEILPSERIIPTNGSREVLLDRPAATRLI